MNRICPLTTKLRKWKHEQQRSDERRFSLAMRVNKLIKIHCLVGWKLFLKILRVENEFRLLFLGIARKNNIGHFVSQRFFLGLATFQDMQSIRYVISPTAIEPTERPCVYLLLIFFRQSRNFLWWLSKKLKFNAPTAVASMNHFFFFFKENKTFIETFFLIEQHLFRHLHSVAL